MNRASPIKRNRRLWYLVGLVLLVAAGSFLWFTRAGLNAAPTYQTVTAATGTLTANVEATGMVRAARSASLDWNSNGRVDAAYVKVGDRVAPDQLLASLARDSVPATVILAESDLVTAQQNLDNLIRSNSDVATAMQNLANSKQVVKDAQDAYDTLTRTRVSSELISETSDLITKAKLQLKLTIDFYNTRYYRMEVNRVIKAQTEIRVTNSRQSLTDLIAKYNWYTSQASLVEVEKALTALNVAKAKQEDAQREMDRRKTGTNVDDITAAQARVAAAKSTLNLAKIMAPFAGTVTQISFQTGDRVSTGQTALRVDDLSQLMVDLQISEVDINNVSAGQLVSLTLDAVPGKTYKGVVSKVNQSAEAGQGGVNFKVSVSLTDADEEVKPGMTANVIITIKEVDNTLLVPNSAVRMLGGQHVIYVLKDNQPMPVNVRLGASANDNSQVVGGDLKAGDVLILNPPAMSNPNTSPTPAK